MSSRLLARLIDGDGASEHEALAYLGGGLVGVVAAFAVLVLGFGLSWIG